MSLCSSTSSYSVGVLLLPTRRSSVASLPTTILKRGLLFLRRKEDVFPTPALGVTTRVRFRWISINFPARFSAYCQVSLFRGWLHIPGFADFVAAGLCAATFASASTAKPDSGGWTRSESSNLSLPSALNSV